jgi:hypothetical protein
MSGGKAEKRSRLRLIPWEAKAKGHYDEAIRIKHPVKTSQTTVFPATDKVFGSV